MISGKDLGIWSLNFLDFGDFTHVMVECANPDTVNSGQSLSIPFFLGLFRQLEVLLEVF